jgi:predicted NAD/FAD-binding protein
MKDVPSDRVFLNTPVKQVSNNISGSVVLQFANSKTDTFDHVILATHADQALLILDSSVTKEERSILSSFKTSKNEVVLHSDLTHMPQRRSAWSSWNYMTLSPLSKLYTDTVSLTYNMNILQHIPEDKFGNVLVTLNPLQQPDPVLTQGRFSYSHPLYTPKTIEAQKRLPAIQNRRGISYAGAWTNYGFHEDGFTSGLKAAQDYLGANIPFDIVDSALSRGKKPNLGIVDYLVRLVIVFIQVFVVQPSELLAGIKRRSDFKEAK